MLERAGRSAPHQKDPLFYVLAAVREWIGTVSSWPENFGYRDMAQVGIELSKRLRDPNGEHKCDIIVALTHARVPNDIALAKALRASSPAAQEEHPIYNEHGVDLILGGHDHLYYISHGATAWEGYDLAHPVLGAEDDKGDVLIVKSGTDFRDLSEFTLELFETPPGSVRRKVIKEIRGKRHATQPGSKKNERIAKLLESILSSVSDALKAPACKTEVELDLRSQLIRVQETVAGNWFADVLRHAYDEAPEMAGGSDGVLICAGTLRGDSIYGPGNVTLGDILEILPFEDPIVALELDGEAIWDALEQSLSTWPAQEGRFPVISGFRVSWDSRRPPGQRVLGVWLLQEPSGSVSASASPTPVPSANASMTSLRSIGATSSGTSTPGQPLVDGEPITRTKGGRKYRIITREYMAQGHDGFLALKGNRYLVDDESGQLMSQLVRKYLLGCRYVNRMSRVADVSTVECLHPQTQSVISKEKARRKDYDRHARSHSHHSHMHSHSQSHSRSRSKTPHHLGADAGTPGSRERSPSPSVVQKWRHAARRALRWSRAHYRDNIHITGREHMSPVDHFDGSSLRKRPIGQQNAGGETKVAKAEDDEEDLAVIHPIVDGRLKDEGRN
ncbi:hypothetical protein EVJ58_g733 [Rhodofomes roseus]|uniref:5'-Nucleotidase C-terminal domain-containing protein n=1 Tax=Rhodofomes roseus TaxID=34475 RepID=A0A4Y9Z2T1_9APHY|nr:hypothetical protein EVJ58_g733 [Rhodofomes roseus]